MHGFDEAGNRIALANAGTGTVFSPWFKASAVLVERVVRWSVIFLVFVLLINSPARRIDSADALDNIFAVKLAANASDENPGISLDEYLRAHFEFDPIGRLVSLHPDTPPNDTERILAARGVDSAGCAL